MKLAIPMALSFAALLHAPALIAAPVHYTFSMHNLNGGGLLSGSFSAEDLNNDGGISSFHDEVLNFEYSLTGDTIIGDFQITQAELETARVATFAINFALDENLIIDGLYNNSPIFQPDAFPFADGFFLVHYIEDETGTIPLVETVFVAGPAAIGGGECVGTFDCTYILQFLTNPDGSSGGSLASGTPDILSLSAVPLPASAWFFITAMAGMAGARKIRVREQVVDGDCS